MKIELHVAHAGFACKPGVFLGREAFDEYREAMRVAGGRFDPATKSYQIRREMLRVAAGELSRLGFELVAVNGAAAAIAELRVEREAEVSPEPVTPEKRAEIEARVHGNRKLFPYQIDGVAFLDGRRRAALFDEMGLGKTVQVLMTLPADAPVVIVAPAVVKGVWIREARAWRPDLHAEPLTGRNSFRWPRAGQVFVTNYDILPPLAAEAEVDKKKRAPLLLDAKHGAPKPGTIIVADEAHLLKGKATKRSKRFRAMVAALNGEGRVIVLTGTPLLNRPPELWAVLEAAELAEEAFGSWGRFSRMFGAARNRFGMSWGAPSDDVPLALRRVSLRRAVDDVLADLPPRRTDVRVVDLDDATRAAIEALIEKLREAGVKVDPEDIGALLECKRSGVAFEMISKLRAILATAKIGAMLETVAEYEAAEEPLVVVSAHRKPVDLFEKREGWAVITGDTPPDQRSHVEERFQRGELKGVALTIKAGGVGITLTHAAHMLFVDREWTPALNRQAADRIRRIGQKRPVLVIDLVTDHALDQRINEVLRDKEELIAAAVDASAVGRALKKALVEDAPDPLAVVVEGEAAPAYVPPTRSYRKAQSAVEAWALAGIERVNSFDPDRAQTLNGVGFSRFDGPVARSVLDFLAAKGGLSDKQWALVVRLARKYRGQIEPEPTETNGGV